MTEHDLLIRSQSRKAPKKGKWRPMRTVARGHIGPKRPERANGMRGRMRGGNVQQWGLDALG